jgi:hypothetical protein
MKRKLTLAAVATVAVLAVGSTVAWSATRGGPGDFDMQTMMECVHPGLGPGDREQMAAICTKPMQDGMRTMHGSESGATGHGMMGGGSMRAGMTL